MVDYVTSINGTDVCLGGITFTSTSLLDFTYKIRLKHTPRNSGNSPTRQNIDWKTRFIYFLFPILGPREKNQNEGGEPG